MLSKRNVIVFLFAVLVFMPACIFTPNGANADCPKCPPEEEKPNSDNCKADGNMYFESPDGQYCLSHPYGYYGYASEDEENVFIFQSADASMIIDEQGMPDGDTPPITDLPGAITLKIRHKANANDQDLWTFVSNEAHIEKIEDVSPWTISDIEQAYISKQHSNKTVVYYIYTQHNKVFYVLEFSAGTTCISDDTRCGDELEKLLFTVNETFHFRNWKD
jgi:hypothetical protein